MSFHAKNTVYVACFLLSTLFLPATALPQLESRGSKEGILVLSLKGMVFLFIESEDTKQRENVNSST